MSLKWAYVIDEYLPMQETILEKTSFMAPEIFAGQPVTPKMDVWSLGVTLFFMLYGCSPWPNAKDNDWHRRLGSSIVFPEDVEVSPKFKITIEKMLVYDPLMRVSINELAH
jgi:serine/threonine protein kinase